MYVSMYGSVYVNMYVNMYESMYIRRFFACCSAAPETVRRTGAPVDRPGSTGAPERVLQKCFGEKPAPVLPVYRSTGAHFETISWKKALPVLRRTWPGSTGAPEHVLQNFPGNPLRCTRPTGAPVHRSAVKTFCEKSIGGHMAPMLSFKNV